MPGKLDGKVAVITGGLAGLGLAAVRRFVAEGAKVVIGDVKREAGEALAAEMGEDVRFVMADVRSEEAFADAIATAVDAFGGLDILYHNAAAPGTAAGIETITTADWDDAQAMLLRASMLAVKLSIPAKRARGGGSIILTSSVSAYNIQKNYPIAYVVAKGGILYLTRHAALQCAPDGIRVNALSPGAVPTAIHLKRFGYDDAMADAMAPHMKTLLFNRLQPIRSAGEAEDVAAAALFLASEESRWITGIDMPVDGGLAIDRQITEADYQVALAEAEVRAKRELGR